jgi:hypothetical protein
LIDGLISYYSGAISPGHTHIVRLPDILSRKLRLFLDTSEAYADLSELVTVALENQLALEGGSADEIRGLGSAARANAGEDSQAQRLLLRPDGGNVPVTGPCIRQDALSPLTNRLLPIKVAARVLANCGETSLDEFQEAAATTARALGLRLRAEDARAQKKGAARRWIAFPTGEDEVAALSRYVHHFALTLDGRGTAIGPLPQLGLAGLSDDACPVLTELGGRLAIAANPVLDGATEDGVLSAPERDVFLDGIRANLEEAASVEEFVRLVDETAGRQSALDRSIRDRHPNWSDAQVVAHRAAMIGRLRDLELVSVEGRGANASVTLALRIHEELEK